MDWIEVETCNHCKLLIVLWFESVFNKCIEEFNIPTQTWLRAVTTYVCKPEAANTVGAPDDERHTARNMLSF